jgi:hypothetical protein
VFLQVGSSIATFADNQQRLQCVENSFIEPLGFSLPLRLGLPPFATDFIFPITKQQSRIGRNFLTGKDLKLSTISTVFA